MVMDMFVSTDPGIGLCKILRGNLAEGIRLIEEAISRRKEEEDWDAAYCIVAFCVMFTYK